MERNTFSISPFPFGHKYYVFVMVKGDGTAWLAEETTGRGLFGLFTKSSIRKAHDKTGNFIPAPQDWLNLTQTGKAGLLGT